VLPHIRAQAFGPRDPGKRIIMSTRRRPAYIAHRSAEVLRARPRDAFRRETFALPREKARNVFAALPRRPNRDRILARTPWRPHRVHHAPAAERGLIRNYESHPRRTLGPLGWGRQETPSGSPVFR
jgi:hypothetical protein